MPGQFVVHERDDLHRQRPERCIREYACGPEGRPDVGLQLGGHQCGRESLAAHIRAEDRHTFGIDHDDVVEIPADDPGRLIQRSQSRPP